MKVGADCLALRDMAQHMRAIAIEYSIMARAARGMGLSLPAMPSHTSGFVTEVLCHVPDELMALAEEMIEDASEIYERADWFDLAGSGGLGWLIGPDGDIDAGGDDRWQWDMIVDGAVAAIGAGIDYGQHSRKTTALISRVWRWSPSAVRRSYASKQIRSAGKVTRWASSRWIRRGGWFLAAVDGVLTYQEHRAEEAARAEALARAAAEVATPALAGWGAAALCGLGLAATPVSGGVSAVACGVVGAGAAIGTDQLGVGEEVGDIVVETTGLDD